MLVCPLLRIVAEDSVPQKLRAIVQHTDTSTDEEEEEDIMETKQVIERALAESVQSVLSPDQFVSIASSTVGFSTLFISFKSGLMFGLNDDRIRKKARGTIEEQRKGKS